MWCCRTRGGRSERQRETDRPEHFLNLYEAETRPRSSKLISIRNTFSRNMGDKKKVVSDYLAKNPGFLKEWISENVALEDIQQWLEQVNKDTLQISNAAESARNSLTCNLFHDLIRGKRKLETRARRSKEELLSMSERELFMELIRDIANELDVNVLCHKILINVSILTRSDRGSLFLVRGSRNNRYLMSKLFDVNENSNLEDCLHNEDNCIRVPLGVGIAGTVAESKKAINIKDAYSDPRFNKEVDKKTGFHTRNILCMPIINYEGDVVGVAQIMNKTSDGDSFTQADEEVFRNYLTFCGIGLTNAQLFEMSVVEYKRNEMMLTLAKGIFEEQTNLDKLVEKIMREALDLLKCQRCAVYLLDNMLEGQRNLFIKNIQGPKGSEDTDDELTITAAYKEINGPEDVDFSKAFILRAEQSEDITIPGQKDLAASSSAKIAKDVAASGKLLNVSDALSDPAYEKEIEDYDGFKIKNFLCVPIKNNDNVVVGVVQLMNKNTGRPFNDSDINSVKAFAIFCGLGIHNCQMYESAVQLMAKQSVALEVLSYHASASAEETDKLKDSTIASSKVFDLFNFDFNDFPLTDDETCQATLRMFLEVDVVALYHVPYEVLCRWILSVKKNYRAVTYHNWRHAFNVMQTMFTMLYTGKTKNFMDPLEMFSLLVACLCHDLDHRGTNNTFQSKSESPLATLYGTSTMEHHHFDQCIMILNSEGNNIFMHLSPTDYRKAISIVENAILSTDLALYFRKKGGFQKLVDSGKADWTNAENKELLRGMMMTACDVAAITKPWEVQREVAQLVAGEFFEQGDLEREKLGEEPMAMMDRQKKDDLPKMQVGFIDAICMPVYTILAKLEPHLKPMHDGCLNNRNNWQSLADEKEALANANNNQSTSDQSSRPATSGKAQIGNIPVEKLRPKTEVSTGEERSAKSKSKTCAIL